MCTHTPTPMETSSSMRKGTADPPARYLLREKWMSVQRPNQNSPQTASDHVLLAAAPSSVCRNSSWWTIKIMADPEYKKSLRQMEEM